jgi:hypothetical protein
MHNTDRTQQYLETPNMENAYEYQEFPQGEVYGEYQGEFEGEYQDESTQASLGELVHPMTGEINQELEMALAAELLSVNNELELDQFLGKLVRSVGRGFKKFARSGFGRALGGALKRVAKMALPIAGRALGSLIPIPGVGTALGGMAADAVGNAVGLEFEGMSNEDREFEVARRIVRTAIESARTLDQIPEGELVMEGEILGTIGNIASRLLPGAASSILGAFTGQAASAGQGSGGIGGNLNIQSPGGWRISAGGQAGGQGSLGSTVGVNTPAPPLRVPRPAPIPNFPPRPIGRGGSGGAGRPGPRSGRWVRSGRNIIVLGA